LRGYSVGSVVAVAASGKPVDSGKPADSDKPAASASKPVASGSNKVASGSNKADSGSNKADSDNNKGDLASRADSASRVDSGKPADSADLRVVELSQADSAERGFLEELEFFPITLANNCQEVSAALRSSDSDLRATQVAVGSAAGLEA